MIIDVNVCVDGGTDEAETVAVVSMVFVFDTAVVLMTADDEEVVTGFEIVVLVRGIEVTGPVGTEVIGPEAVAELLVREPDEADAVGVVAGAAVLVPVVFVVAIRTRCLDTRGQRDYSSVPCRLCPQSVKNVTSKMRATSALAGAQSSRPNSQQGQSERNEEVSMSECNSLTSVPCPVSSAQYQSSTVCQMPENSERPFGKMRDHNGRAARKRQSPPRGARGLCKAAEMRAGVRQR